MWTNHFHSIDAHDANPRSGQSIGANIQLGVGQR
jgi:hypothetical protein